MEFFSYVVKPLSNEIQLFLLRALIRLVASFGISERRPVCRMLNFQLFAQFIVYALLVTTTAARVLR